MRLEAGTQGPFPVFDAGEGGQGGGRQFFRGVMRPYVADQVVAVFSRHPDVTQHHVRLERLDQFASLAHIRRDGHFRLAFREHQADELAGVRFVIDDQHLEAGFKQPCPGQ